MIALVLALLAIPILISLACGSTTQTSESTLIPIISLTPSAITIDTQNPTETSVPVLIPSPITEQTHALEDGECLPANTGRQIAQLVSVTDGDTIDVLIDGIVYPVRYIGMDTPEVGEPDGAVSSDKNYELVVNKELTLIKDVSDTDRYDRLLRYVIADGKFVNYELVRQGYASAGSWPPDTSCDQMFRDAEQKARDEKLGLWASLSPAAEEPGNVVIADIFYNGVKGNTEPDEYVEIRNDDVVAIQLKGWTLKDKANHQFTFPEYIIEPGEICRVYTNEYHPEWCNFNYVFSNSAIWNNGGDCASLMDAQGITIGEYCY